MNSSATNINDELLDLVNDQDEVIGTVWKSEAHNNPKLIHREVGLAVFNNQGEVLLQQRSMNKAKKPGVWQVTAAGHVQSGENPEVAINRELQEEMGFTVNPIYTSKVFDTYENKESRFTWQYYAIVENTPDVVLNPEEVMNYAWVRIDQLKNFAKKHDYSLTGSSHKYIIEIINRLGF
jgi:isopentenyl-diphosphate delta-isomerase